MYACSCHLISISVATIIQILHYNTDTEDIENLNHVGTWKTGRVPTWSTRFEMYTKWLQQYFTANDRAAKQKQRAILIRCCGASTYRLKKDVLAPQAATDVDYAEVMEKILTRFHQPPPTEIMQRYRFKHESSSTSRISSDLPNSVKKASEILQLWNLFRKCFVTVLSVESLTSDSRSDGRSDCWFNVRLKFKFTPFVVCPAQPRREYLVTPVHPFRNTGMQLKLCVFYFPTY